MAKQIANVDILTDTFQTWVLRTNDIIDILNTDVITANSTLGITGSQAAPKNARLFGQFTATSLAASNANFESFQSNATHIVVNPTALLVAGGTTGAAGGQYLTSNGTHLSWTTAPGTGTVSYVANGAGLIGGPITSTGTLRVRAGDGIVVDSRGVSVNTAFVSSQITTVNTLKGFDWESPGAIGKVTANSGNFTVSTATSYKLTGDASFEITSSGIKTAGNVDALTPGDGTTNTTGAFRIRARGTGRGSLQFTNQAGTVEYGYAAVDSTGRWTWKGNQSVTGSLTINTDNTTGGGLVLSDDGDIVDLNDGYASMRFASGVAIYSGNKSGTSAIRLKNTGVIEAAGDIFSNSNKVLTLADFTGIDKSLLVQSGFTVLPNGLIIQWGSVPATFGETTSSVTFPLTFNQVFSCVATTINSNASNENDYWMQVYFLSNSGCTFYHNSSDGGGDASPGYYIAIGR